MAQKFKNGLAGLLCGALLAISGFIAQAEAETSDLRCAQVFLDLKNLDVGPLNGKVSKKLAAAASKYVTKSKTGLPDLNAETASAWCAHAKSDKTFAALLNYTYNTGIFSKKGVRPKKDLNQVLLADSVGKFKIADRSIKKPTALEFVELNSGVSAARISVNYADEGHREDWFYNDKPGMQHRFELTEQRSFSMKPGKAYWLRLSVFLPEWFDTGDQMTLTDMKPMVNGLLRDPVVSLVIAKRGGSDLLQIHHIVGRVQDCVIGYNEGGGENTYCDLSKQQAFFEPAMGLKGKWLNFVYRVNWANDDKGSYHLWLNDKLLVGYKGKTLHGAEFITHKFGVYRGYYHSQGMRQPNASVYFTGEGRSGTCEGLGLSNCAQFEADAKTTGAPGVTGTNLVEEMEKTRYVETGGKIMKGKKK